MPRFNLGRPRGFGGLISDDDSDDLHFDQGSTIMTDSEAENVARPIKRERSSKANAMPPKSKRQKKMSPPPKERRERGALRDKTNGRQARREREESDDTVDARDAREFDEREDTVDETILSMDELDASMISIQRPAKASTTKSKTVVKQEKPTKTKKKAEPIVDETQRPVKLERKTKKEQKVVQKKRRRGEETEDEAVYEIPETQVAAEEVLEQSIEVEEELVEELEAELEAESTPKPLVVRRPSVIRKPKSPIRQTSVQLRHPRGGSFSDTERIDPAGRRKIGDLQAKLDKMELKYRKLREVGIDAAEANYEKLRSQSEDSAKAARAIIAQLKAESAAKDMKLKEFRNMQKTLDEKDTEIARQKERTAQASEALATAQAENKGLMTKLNAMKNAASNIESVNAAKIPGSAQKTGAVRIMGSAETVQAAQVAQLKLALYSDLTSLIVRSVKREEEEDVFDCIQTGKNGSKSPFPSVTLLFAINSY